MYPCAILSTLLYVLQKKSAAEHPDIPMFYERLVPSLITKTVMALISPPESGSLAILADDSVLEIAGRVVNLVIRSLDASKQEKALQDAFDLFINNKPSGLISDKKDQVAQVFRPFGPGKVSGHASCVVIFTCIVAGIREEVSLDLHGIV